jgi:NifU-like protein involved in Fe-S cluster formation
MSPAGAYNPRVLAHFATPAHAGDLSQRYPVESKGEARESASGCRVVLVAGSDGRVFREVRFRVFGCPHLVAAAEEWCRHAQGRCVGAKDARPAVAELMASLEVPVEKTGRILVLEDAWQALLKTIDREPNRAGHDQR